MVSPPTCQVSSTIFYIAVSTSAVRLLLKKYPFNYLGIVTIEIFDQALFPDHGYALAARFGLDSKPKYRRPPLYPLTLATIFVWLKTFHVVMARCQTRSLPPDATSDACSLQRARFRVLGRLISQAGPRDAPFPGSKPRRVYPSRG